MGVVAALGGLLFAANARLAQDTSVLSVRQPQNLAQMVADGSNRVTDLNLRVTDLTLEVEGLAGAIHTPEISENAETMVRESSAIGFTAVTGPGITVTLDDAPASSQNIPGVVPDDLVIHQQDLQAVITALWAGGAEAMTLMGERVTMTSAFRCTGNVLLLHGRVFSPPFVVSAIGNPQTMEAAVMASEGVQTFLGYASWLGLGFNLAPEADLTFPAYHGGHSLTFASLPAEIDPFRH